MESSEGKENKMRAASPNKRFVGKGGERKVLDDPHYAAGVGYVSGEEVLEHYRDTLAEASEENKLLAWAFGCFGDSWRPAGFETLSEAQLAAEAERLRTSHKFETAEEFEAWLGGESEVE